MPPESIAKLFDIFAQSASASHLSRGGLGIGLFLVKSLTEMHGGSVSAHSEGPGKGSRFAIRLPSPAGDRRRTGAMRWWLDSTPTSPSRRGLKTYTRYWPDSPQSQTPSRPEWSARAMAIRARSRPPLPLHRHNVPVGNSPPARDALPT